MKNILFLITLLGFLGCVVPTKNNVIERPQYKYYSEIYYHRFGLFKGKQFSLGVITIIYETDFTIHGSNDRPLDPKIGINDYKDLLKMLDLMCYANDIPVPKYYGWFLNREPSPSRFGFTVQTGYEYIIGDSLIFRGYCTNYGTGKADFYWVKIDMKSRETFHVTWYKTEPDSEAYDNKLFPTQYLVYTRVSSLYNEE